MTRAPVITPLDVKASHRDNRGDDEHHYGFVYFDDEYPNYDGQDVRVGYMGGTYDPDAEQDASLHSVERYSPYVFNANWGEATFSHIIAAWDLLVATDTEGFAEYAIDNPDTIRWMNGNEFIPADRATLELAAAQERNAALRRRRSRARASRG